MMSKVTVLFVFSLFVVDVLANDDEWSAFKVNFSKTYDKAEENERRKIFEDNLLKIKENNKKYDEGLVSYKLCINKFADLKPGELSAKHYTGFAYKSPPQLQLHKCTKKTGSKDMKCTKDYINTSEVPESIDWREKGVVTDVKDQGNCSSCWAFSATGVIEGQMAIKTGKLVPLSEQQLIDCDTEYSLGCNNGTTLHSFFYVQNNGLMTSEDYPYKAEQIDCNASTTDKSNRVFVQDSYAIEPNSEDDLKAAVGLLGPISVVLYADIVSFAHYHEGIYHGNCDGDPNHAVLLVGYDKDKKTGDEYWIIKNSYGSNWGEKGYLRLRKGQNLCGITMIPTYATYDKERSMQPSPRVVDEL